MGDKHEEVTQQTADVPISDFDGAVRVLARFKLVQCLGSSVALSLVGNAANFASNRFFGTSMLDPLGLISAGVMFGFAPGAVAWIGETLNTTQSARLAWAKAQAEIERITGADLNESGAVGDVVIPEPPVKEVVRVVPVRTSAQIKQIEGLNAQDLYEFVEQLPVRGMTRAAWVGAYTFESGRSCTREFYNAALEIIGRIGAIEGRGRGSDGRLTMTPDQINAQLG